jgi:hypothetical protein
MPAPRARRSANARRILAEEGAVGDLDFSNGSRPLAPSFARAAFVEGPYST